jgi:uncharacterized membrane protein (UPF0127 family)
VAASFLAPLAHDASHQYLLWNERTDRPLARVLEPAFDSRARNKGLLGRTGLQPDSALILAPCWAIHSWFMRFAIDVVFVDRTGTVVKVRPALRPWRIAIARGAFAVIELPPGAIACSATVNGDRLLLRRK